MKAPGCEECSRASSPGEGLSSGQRGGLQDPLRGLHVA